MKDTDFFSRKEKITTNEAELIEKKLNQLEKKEKIRFLHLKDIIFNIGERMFVNLKNNDIWIFIPPEFPTLGKLIPLKDMITETELDLNSIRSKINLPIEINKNRKIKIVFNIDYLDQKFLEKIQFALKLKIEKIELINDNQKEILEDITTNLKDKILNFLSFKIYFANFNSLIFSVNKNINTLNTIFYLDSIYPDRIQNFNFTFKELYDFTKNYNGNIFIYGTKFQITDDFKLETLNWIPIEEWEDFPVPLPKNPRIIKKYDSIEITLFSYEDFYKFIFLLVDLFKIPKNSVEVYYEWYEEEKKDSIPIQLESLEKFKDSFIYQKDFKVYDKNIIINNLCSFSYDHNLGYKEVIYTNEYTKSTQKDIFFLGNPSKVRFETQILLENENLIFGNYSLSLPTFLDAMRKLFHISKKFILSDL